MKTRKNTYEKPLSGTGKVKVGEKSFTIDLTYRVDKDKFEEEKFTFKLADLPDNLPDGWEIINGKEYFASVSADGSKLLNIRPAKGTYVVRCTNFSEKDEGDFLILTKDGQYGPYSQFVPLLTVQKGPNKGIDYPFYLPYASGDRTRLACGDGGLMEVVGDPEKSKPVAALYDFLTYTKVIEEEIEYPMDGDDPDDDPQAVLGVLLKSIRKAKADFLVLIENGYPKSLAEVEDDSVPDTDPDEKVTEPEKEEKPAKKSKHNWADD